MIFEVKPDDVSRLEEGLDQSADNTPKIFAVPRLEPEKITEANNPVAIHQKRFPGQSETPVIKLK